MKVTVLSTITMMVIITAYGQDTWTTLPSLPTAVADVTATVLPSQNMIVLVGGCDGGQSCSSGPFCGCTNVTNAVQIYNPSTETWMVGPPAPSPRFRHSAALIDSKLYILGGRDIADNVLASVDVLDVSGPVSGWTWSANVAQIPTPRSDACAMVLSSPPGIYLVGGYTGTYSSLASIDIYTPGTGWSAAAPLATSRGDLGCAAINAQTGYVFGGFNDNAFCAPLNSLEEYSVGSNAWQTRASLAQGRGDKAAVAVDSRLFVIGGEIKNATSDCSKYSFPLQDVEVYDPSSNTWSQDTPIPDKRFRFAAAHSGNAIYVFGGQGELIVSSDSYNVLSTAEALLIASPTVSSSFSSSLPSTSYAFLPLFIPILLSILSILSILSFI